MKIKLKNKAFENELQKLIELILQEKTEQIDLNSIFQAQNQIKKLQENDNDLKDDIQFLSKENATITDKLMNTQSDLEKQRMLQRNSEEP